MLSIARRPSWVLCLNATFLAVIGFLTVNAQAHHTYVTKYDPGKVITLRGVISSVDYRNPHITFDVDVTYKNGSSVTWRVETESIAKVQAKGLTQNVLKQGATAVITGWRAREGSAELGLKTISIGGRNFAIRRTAR